MKVLITGSAGYIGTVMTQFLRAEGHDVIGLDAGFFAECVLGTWSTHQSDLRKDIRDIEVIDLQGFDAVIHLAALSNDPLGDLQPQLTYNINYLASVRLADLAREAGVQRFLFASSCSMYGAAGDQILNESSELRPLTPYAISKVRTEFDVAKLATDQFSPVFMRNGTAYGYSARLRADVVLNNLMCWAFTTGSVRIMSDGTPWRPIVHVEDIARAFAAVLTAPREAIHNQAFNVGRNDENYQVRDIANIVVSTVPGSTVEYAGQGGPDPRSYRVDFCKLAKHLPDLELKWNAVLGAKELYQSFHHAHLTRADFEGHKFVRLHHLRHLLHAGLLTDTLRWSKA